MNIQDYIAPHSKDMQRVHYANTDDQSRSSHFQRPVAATSTTLSSIPEYESVIPSITTEDVSGSSTMKQETNSTSLDPALLLTRYDKRKSSPAVLGLPFGLSDQSQLEFHLSQQRNSIEAAMLLANFNRLPTTSKPDQGKSTPWQDDMSLATQQKPSWDDELATSSESEAMRRHSYDVNMSWKTMPPSFLGRSDLLPNLASSSSSTENEDVEAAKLSWTQDGMVMNGTGENSTGEYAHMFEFMQHPTSPRPPSPPTFVKPAPQQPSPFYYQQQTYPPPPLPPPYQAPLHHMKQDQPPTSMEYYRTYSQPPPLHPYYYPQQPTLMAASAASTAQIPQTTARPTKRRKNKDDEEGDVVEPGDADFPDMAQRDVDAARTDPEARPRRQKMRFDDDQYTPRWVRYNGQAKEGLCDTCSPGKWLQLKNSAFWYHKQFFHGISSVSGRPFIQPVETRWVDQDLVEGLCHQCGQWVAVSNVKRKNSVLWYRHAHKCHVYHKPKTGTPKKR